MELFILDPLLRPIDVVDEFISLIWTERFSEWGDFELVTLSTFANEKRFVPDTLVSITESKRVMKVESTEVTFDEENGDVLKVKGRDLLALTDSRSAIRISPIEDKFVQTWFINALPVSVMRFMFQGICVSGDVSPDDVIPFIEWDESLYPEDNIPAPVEEIRWAQKPDTLYNALRAVADIYDLGFRLYKDPNASKLYFNVYTGNDRTSAQTELMPVIFSADMENLQNTHEFNDVSKEANVIHVLYFATAEDIYATESVIVFDPDIDDTGFTRKVKTITVTSIPEEVLPIDIPDYLYQLGLEELANSRPVGVFDGEVDQSSQYVYDIDYFLGDIVEIRGRNGSTGFMRVDEQIFVQDSSGQRSYPSLITKSFVGAGTWASWKYDVEWSLFGSEEYWNTQ